MVPPAVKVSGWHIKEKTCSQRIVNNKILKSNRKLFLYPIITLKDIYILVLIEAISSVEVFIFMSIFNLCKNYACKIFFFL